MTKEEAIKIVRENIHLSYDKGNIFEALKTLVPELAEWSEDERIRKELVEYHKQQFEKNRDQEVGLFHKDAIAYLEKQKVQKSTECIEFANEFEKQVSHLLASVLNGEYEYNKNFIKYAAQSLLGYAKNELKSTEWSKEDENKIERLAFLVSVVEEKEMISPSESIDLRNFIKSLCPQPKQEWSDEDEKCIKDIIDCLKYLEMEDTERQYNGDRNVNPRRYADMITKLKSLCPQPKHSQEEIVLHWESGHPEPYKSVLILRHGNVVVEGEWDEKTKRWYQYGFQSYLEDNEVNGWMSKKSLLSNNFNFYPSWKPSEEQMRALDKVIPLCIGVVGRKGIAPLESLYEQLKKIQS